MEMEITVTAEPSGAPKAPPPTAAAGEGANGTAPSPPCLACHSNPIEYCSSTCRHALFCKKCAMKCATGGKCKVCGEMFPDLRRI